jgi:hypothetical protein
MQQMQQMQQKPAMGGYTPMSAMKSGGNPALAGMGMNMGGMGMGAMSGSMGGMGSMMGGMPGGASPFAGLLQQLQQPAQPQMSFGRQYQFSNGAEAQSNDYDDEEDEEMEQPKSKRRIQKQKSTHKIIYSK